MIARLKKGNDRLNDGIVGLNNIIQYERDKTIEELIKDK
jgi:hypothetical protein